MANMTSSFVDILVFCRDDIRPVYLVLHAAPEKQYAGQWQILNGKVDPGEKAFMAAVRELYMRTGLKAIDLFALDYVHSSYDPQTDTVNLNPTFAIEVETTDVALSDGYDASRWITFDQAISLLTLPGQREGLRRAHEDVVATPDRGNVFRVIVNG